MNEPLRYHGTTVSRGRMVPLISSYVAGPLGLIHLPRLWLKALLHAHDRLAEDWGCGPGGLDKIILSYVGVDGATFMTWLMSELPDYAACEAWVCKNATNLSPDAIAESNAKLRSIGLPGDLNAQFRAHMHIEDDTVDVGIMLNSLDDWDTVHRYAIANREDLEPIVPAISPLSSGLLGVPNLPRQWLKDVLHPLSALPDNYPVVEETTDAIVLERLGVEPATARAYVRHDLPSYLEYEQWIREQTTEKRLLFAQRYEGDDLEQAVATHAIDWALLHAEIAQEGSNTRNKTGLFAFSVTPLVRR